MLFIWHTLKALDIIKTGKTAVRFQAFIHTMVQLKIYFLDLDRNYSHEVLRKQSSQWCRVRNS